MVVLGQDGIEALAGLAEYVLRLYEVRRLTGVDDLARGRHHLDHEVADLERSSLGLVRNRQCPVFLCAMRCVILRKAAPRSHA